MAILNESLMELRAGMNHLGRVSDTTACWLEILPAAMIAAHYQVAIIT